MTLQADAYVLAYGQVREHRGNLKRADHAPPRNLRWLFARDVDAVEQNGAGGRLQELGQQVEAGGLARAVRPDQGVDRAAAYIQVDFTDGSKASE
ncbi:hypothetical protein D3C72_1853280 [compost metagenome]